MSIRLSTYSCEENRINLNRNEQKASIIRKIRINFMSIRFSTYLFEDHRININGTVQNHKSYAEPGVKKMVIRAFTLDWLFLRHFTS